VEFELVQTELTKRKQLGGRYSGNSIFSAKLVCSDCGSFYGSKVWHSTSKYKRTIWQCNNKFKGENRCTTPHIDENTIKEKFIVAFNQIVQKRDEVIDNCRLVQKVLSDCTDADKQIQQRQQELEAMAELIRKLVLKNATSAMNQEEYLSRYADYGQRYDGIKTDILGLKTEKQERIDKKRRINSFLSDLEKQDGLLDEFDDELWTVMVDKVVVHEDRLVFGFKGGMEVAVEV
jgi:hypothetical protein